MKHQRTVATAVAPMDVDYFASASASTAPELALSGTAPLSEDPLFDASFFDREDQALDHDPAAETAMEAIIAEIRGDSSEGNALTQLLSALEAEDLDHAGSAPAFTGLASALPTGPASAPPEHSPSSLISLVILALSMIGLWTN